VFPFYGAAQSAIGAACGRVGLELKFDRPGQSQTSGAPCSEGRHGSAAQFLSARRRTTLVSSVAIVTLSLIWYCEKVEKREWYDILGSSDVTLVEGTRQSEPWRVVRADVETILMLWETKGSHSPSMTL
jgi:hypothetical protein